MSYKPVVLTAPATHNGKQCMGWRVGDIALTGNNTLTLDEAGDHNATAVYADLAREFSVNPSVQKSHYDVVRKPVSGNNHYTYEDIGLLHPAVYNELVQMPWGSSGGRVAQYTNWSYGISGSWPYQEYYMRVSQSIYTGVQNVSSGEHIVKSIQFSITKSPPDAQFTPQRVVFAFNKNSDNFNDYAYLGNVFSLPGCNALTMGAHLYTLPNPMPIEKMLIFSYALDWTPVETPHLQAGGQLYGNLYFEYE